MGLLGHNSNIKWGKINHICSEENSYGWTTLSKMSIAYNCSYEQFTFVRHAAGEILHTYLTRDYWMELVYKSSAPCYVPNSVLSFSSFLLFIFGLLPKEFNSLGSAILHHTPYLPTQQPPQVLSTFIVLTSNVSGL